MHGMGDVDYHTLTSALRYYDVCLEVGGNGFSTKYKYE